MQLITRLALVYSHLNAKANTADKQVLNANLHSTKKPKGIKKPNLRKLFLWIHRWLGLVSGLVVLVVSLTGCIYVFEEEIRNTFQQQYLYIHPPESNTARQPIDTLWQIAQAALPRKDTLVQLRFKTQPNAAYVFITQTKKSVSVNPYSGAITGIRNLKSDFLYIILELHKNLLLGSVGKQIIKWNVLIFFILCISGLIVWWPKQKRFFKQAVSIKWQAKNLKRLTWDLHAVLGFYALGVLLMIAFTGMFWMFDSVKQITAAVTGTAYVKREPPKSMQHGKQLYKLQQAYTHADMRYPGATEVHLHKPMEGNQALRVSLRYPYWLVRNHNNLFYHPQTGQILRQDLYRQYTTFDKVKHSNYSLHTGNIPALGMGSKIIYFLASLFSASLPVTGFLIWYNRGKKKKAAHLKTGKLRHQA